MSVYRVFVKDCLELAGRSKSNVICISFDVKRDLLEKSVSTFVVERIDTNVDIGDILGLYDAYGTLIYIGVVDEIDTTSNQISCTSNVSYFKYLWLYNAYREQTGSTESLMKKAFEDTFKNATDYLMETKYSDINIQLITSRLSYKLPLKDDMYTEDFEDFIYDCYNNFGIVCNFVVPFEEGTPTLTIDAGAMLRDPIKIGNNFNAIQNFNVETDTFENNKLIIYNADGTELRHIYYGTADGITDDDESPLRIKKINNVIQFTDEEIPLVLAQNLQNKMYNHIIRFDMLLDNNFYNFFEQFVLGCPIDLWYNGIHFDSVFTGYELIKEENTEISSVRITCGKVRNTLTSKILKYVR